jgi:hypothetical protein
MLLSIILMIVVLPPIDSMYQAQIGLSSPGYQFQYRYSIQLISTLTTRNRMICTAECDQEPLCHTFDYDSASRRCRLFEGDLDTGSIVASTSLTSIVGTVIISPSLFDLTHNQSCERCQENRYVYCPVNISTCQCRPHTFWNNSVCSLQLFENDTCSQIDACRADLNLTCSKLDNGTFSQCKPINSVNSKRIDTKDNLKRVIEKIILSENFS